jgi:diguanylate cyclase (GGDEF)-like protein
LYLVSSYPSLDRLDLFIPNARGGFSKITAGDSAPPSPEVVSNRLLVFRLNVPGGGQTTYYLRASSKGAMRLPLTIWTPEAFHARDRWDQLAFGLLFGVVLAFIVFFGAPGVRLRHRACLWFASYLFSLSVLLAGRMGLLLDLFGWVGPHALNLAQICSIGLVYFTGAKFFRVFLNLREYSPTVDRIEQALQWLGILYIPIWISNTSLITPLAVLVVGLGPLFSTAVAMVLWAKGVPNAKYFALGWLAGHITSTVDLLCIFGRIPYLSFMAYTIPLALISTLLILTIALVEQTRAYKDHSGRDGLTGLANRRRFDEFLAMEWNRGGRYQRPLALIMADVDLFKDYNDTYGHKAGDECLVKIAGVLSDNARRAGEMAARFGGEEFTILLADAGLDQAVELAEMIRVQVEGLAIAHSASRVKPVVTLSLGAAAMIPDHYTKPDALIRKADAALYQAKVSGRNQVSSPLNAPARGGAGSRGVAPAKQKESGPGAL